MNVNDVVGCEISAIGRCLNLLWIIFKKDGLEYSFHIQCAWRIVINNKIFLTNIDLYEENGERFDSQIKQLNLNKVEDIRINECNDIKILFNDNSFMNVFVNDYDECWRFFQTGNTEIEHFVVYANKAEYE